jgi:hypothetical protein
MLKKGSLPAKESPSTKWTSRGNLRWLLVGSIIGPLLAAFAAWAKRFHYVSGRCSSRLVLYSCEIKASASSGNAPHEMELKYAFADLPTTNHTVRLLEKISDSAVLTSDLGQQKLWSRALTLLFLLSCCLSPPFFYFRARRKSKLALQRGL